MKTKFLKMTISKARIKNGSQHAIKAPVTMAKVLAAFRSLLTSKETCFLLAAPADDDEPGIGTSMATTVIGGVSSRSIKTPNLIIYLHLKSVFLDIRSEDMILMYFPPKFEF